MIKQVFLQFLQGLITLIIIIVPTHLLITFVEWNVNPFEWSELSRAGFIVIYAYLVKMLLNYNKNNK